MFWTSLAALLSGACNAGLVGFVSSALTRTGPTTRAFIWGFILLGLGKVATNLVSQIVLARFSRVLLRSCGAI